MRLIDWRPTLPQLDFHLRRFAMLCDYFTVVFDAAHWWLNAMDAFFAAFPDGKAIGLERETEACVASFLKIKGTGPGSINHWAPAGGRMWMPNVWDACYPVYSSPPSSRFSPEEAKRRAIRRYVSEYNGALAEWAAAAPDRILLVCTEELSEAATQARIFGVVGRTGRVTNLKLNAGSIADADVR